jgi:pyruvate/2-oxoglutarate dehydrogenase complex dihydrolipoamide acyltransferase (E2) component
MEMTEGTLSSWLADDGAAVSQDQPVYLLETDKVENEITAPIDGTLRHIGAEGETYPVGEVIATIE